MNDKQWTECRVAAESGVPFEVLADMFGVDENDIISHATHSRWKIDGLVIEPEPVKGGSNDEDLRSIQGDNCKGEKIVVKDEDKSDDFEIIFSAPKSLKTMLEKLEEIEVDSETMDKYMTVAGHQWCIPIMKKMVEVGRFIDGMKPKEVLDNAAKISKINDMMTGLTNLGRDKEAATVTKTLVEVHKAAEDRMRKFQQRKGVLFDKMDQKSLITIEDSTLTEPNNHDIQ